MAGRGRHGGDWMYYEPTKPREVEGGIKSCSRRGAFASSWWGKRWIAVLESFRIGARLSRGRAYARKGQVANLAVKAGEVLASVQGSRAKPYAVSIRLSTLGEADRAKVGQAILERPLMAARLLAGDMPEDLEEAAKSAGVHLFPAREGDLRTECSCPDWSNPCKHIAAVYYLLAEAFDRDPFLLLKLRGLERSDLLAMLGADESKNGENPPMKLEAESAAPAPLLPDSAAFWTGAPLRPQKVPSAAPDPAVLVRRLGPLPFWRGREDFLPALEAICNSAVRTGIALLEQDVDLGSEVKE